MTWLLTAFYPLSCDSHSLFPACFHELSVREASRVILTCPVARVLRCGKKQRFQLSRHLPSRLPRDFLQVCIKYTYICVFSCANPFALPHLSPCMCDNDTCQVHQRGERSRESDNPVFSLCYLRRPLSWTLGRSRHEYPSSCLPKPRRRGHGKLENKCPAFSGAIRFLTPRNMFIFQGFGLLL